MGPCSDDLDVTYDREDYNSFKINLGNWSASSNYYEFWSHFYRGIRSATYFIQHIGENQEMLNDPTRGPLVVEQYKNEAASCARGSITTSCASTVPACCWETKCFPATSTATTSR